jgi:CPA2 family monovalent cation:H+ antiporter-2
MPHSISLITTIAEEATLLRRENLGTVFMGEHQLAQAMTREVLHRLRLEVPERRQNIAI